MDFARLDIGGQVTTDNFVYVASENYTIMTAADIYRRQEEDIKVSISRVAASILLRHYNWSISKVIDECFADEKVRKQVGLVDPVALSDDKELTCGICFEDYYRDMISGAACGHPFRVFCLQELLYVCSCTCSPYCKVCT